MLHTFASGIKPMHSMGIATEVFLVLALELLGIVGDKMVIKVLATKMGVAGCGLHLKVAFLNSEKWDIECSTAGIKNEDVLLICDMLLIKTIGDSSSSWLVDNMKDL